jgi:hypothetical protein
VAAAETLDFRCQRRMIVWLAFEGGRPKMSSREAILVSVAVVSVCSLALTAPAQAYPVVARSQALQCDYRLRQLVNELVTMQGEMDVGLNYVRFKAELTRVAIAYRFQTVALPRMSRSCLNVAVHAEKAYNAYIVASNYWSACIRNLCNFNSAYEQSIFQERLQIASAQIDAAATGLG